MFLPCCQYRWLRRSPREIRLWVEGGTGRYSNQKASLLKDRRLLDFLPAPNVRDVRSASESLFSMGGAVERIHGGRRAMASSLVISVECDSSNISGAMDRG